MKTPGVYRWVTDRAGVRNPNGSNQAEHVVLAYSRAEAARLARTPVSVLTNHGSWTGNAEDIAVAQSAPSRVFYRPVTAHSAPGAWQATLHAGEEALPGADRAEILRIRTAEARAVAREAVGKRA